MTNSILFGLIILFLALISIIFLVVWSCRIIDRLNESGEKTAREIIKEKENE